MIIARLGNKAPLTYNNTWGGVGTQVQRGACVTYFAEEGVFF